MALHSGCVCEKAQCPCLPVSQTHTSTEEKAQDPFCIRIYYLKGSLKIKILYSIMNSFFFFFFLFPPFFVSVNKMVLVVGAGGQDQLLPAEESHAEWLGPVPAGGHLLPSGKACSGEKRVPGLSLMGLKRAGDVASVTGLDVHRV